PGGSPVDFEGGVRTGLRFRLEVFVAAVSLAPILILAQAALNLMLSEKDEIKTSVPVIVGVSLGLIILSQVFSVLLARYLRHPIAQMRGAVNRIEQLDFNVHIPITANDEIAQLANGINNMAAGLREKEIIKEKFGRAVDPRVRDFLLNQSIEPGGEEKDVTVLFADIRGFTTFSEGRAPSEVVAWLNRFFEEMSGAIEAHGGLVNKYIGDAILAVFNAPLPLADHPRHAVEAAQEMLERLEKLNQQVEQSDTATIRIGIGIETGTAMVGNIGSQNRLEYTVIGDAVNTASRVESLCKRFDCSLLITERVARAIENTHTATKVARGKVKGKQSTATVYTL
ncbi:MAG: adenylate/guanylate cyclase domain-containing protein, partial [Leptospiraceae bacterium]|nr:adenylate/guanylate cyclase domain-containing protein [Leptospiraceae bacterium]